MNVTLSVNTSSVNLSRQFLGTTVNNEVRMFRGESDAVNATPVHALVWPGGLAGEDYDPLTDTHYNSYNGTPNHALTNESQFIQMCRAIHCIAIMQVPAEIDDPSIAEKIVNFTEVNLSFRPAYWMIGNEPELWYKWQVPWKDWPTQSTQGPDPTQFGDEVLAYVKAIRAVDNTTPILGLPASGCSCGPSGLTFDQWISGVLKVTGSKIQAVSFHEYPAGWLGTGDGSLQTFYGTIQGAAGIPVRMAAARLAVQTACPRCNVSVFISELGSALSWSPYGQYALGFSGALSIASQLTQAMDVNLSNIDLFATELATKNSWFDPMGHARPDYTLYTGILGHLASESFAVNLSGWSNDLYGIDTIAPDDHGRRDLLVVNDDIGRAISFSPQFANSPGPAPVEAWSWNGSIHQTSANSTTWVEPYTPSPIPRSFPDGLPSSYVLPPQSLVLFESYPSGATVVRVNETGVPAGTPWYASVGPRFYTTTASNFSLLVPAGTYSVGSVGIPLPLGGREVVPIERLGPSAPASINVSGRYTNFTVGFSPQWRMILNVSPAADGIIRPAVDWANASEPLTLTAAPLPGFAFLRWSGWGPGSYQGTRETITVVPTGRTFESARFVPSNVDLWETGLPTGTPWSVTVRGSLYQSNTTQIELYETPGTYGFAVTPVPGYRSLPINGAFTVQGTSTFAEVQFIRLTPPQSTFPVTFTVSGLPDSVQVPISVRAAMANVSTLTAESAPQFELTNGSYAYHVGYVAGYHPVPREKTFYVAGERLTVEIAFVPTEYPVVWVAVGSRSGMNWTVAVDGQTFAATSAWVTVLLTNGSYPFSIAVSSNFSASPRTGVVELNASPQTLTLDFGLVMFSTRFEAPGWGGQDGWSIRLGNLTQSASSGRSTFLSANGTYTFDVHPPAGYYAVPSHGTLNVAGPTPPLIIAFHRSSQLPSAALVAALTAGAFSESVWIGASIFVGFGAVRGLKGRAGGGHTARAGRGAPLPRNRR